VTGQMAFAAAATVVALAFTFVTLDRWQITRRRHEAAWTTALALFTGASASLLIGASVGWGSASFRTFYYLGAIANVPVLALGTIELLLGSRWGRQCTRVVAAFCLFSAGVMAVAPLSAPIESDTLPRGSDVFEPLPRVLAAVGSGVGALVIFVGAMLSIVRLVRSSAPGRLAMANALIAAGTVVLSVGGLFNSVANEMTSFAISLVLGIALIFAGFLTATVSSPARLLTSVPPLPTRLENVAPPDGGSPSDFEVERGSG
jgi:hypothetical protein